MSIKVFYAFILMLFFTTLLDLPIEGQGGSKDNQCTIRMFSEEEAKQFFDDDEINLKDFGKQHFSQKELIGDTFYTKFHHFDCLCGKRLWCSNALYRKVTIEGSLCPSITSEMIDSKKLPYFMLWKKASDVQRGEYYDDLIVHLPWYPLVNEPKENPNNMNYVIMQCDDPKCRAVLKALVDWEQELRQTQSS